MTRWQTFVLPGLVFALGAVLLLVLASTFADPARDGPVEVHLGLPTGDPATSRSILWRDTSPDPQEAVVLVEPDGTERRIPAMSVPGAAEGVYEAQLTGLTPNASYGYRVGEHAYGFTTPAASADGTSFSFVALGDMGVTDEAEATVRTVLELDPAFVLHPGDISYAEGDARTWWRWFHLVEPVAAHIPWVTALGNHEAAPAGAEVASYQQRFGLPGNELWYSFDWEGVHFVALDTFSPGGSHGGSIPEEQLRWLERDLAAHADARWTVVFLHEPPYSSNNHGSSARAQQAFVPLFEEHGVDLVVSAHDHAYERSHPLRGGAPAGDGDARIEEGEGVVYLVTGGAGRRLYDEWAQPAPAWSATREAVFHVVEFTVTPDALEGRVVPTTGEGAADAFRIEKAAPPG